MHVVELAPTPAHPAPLAEGPMVRALLGPDSSPVALLRMTLPAAAVLPPHAHGQSYVVLIPLRGRVCVKHDGGEHELAPGGAAYVDVGERIGVTNRGPDAAEICVVVTPPEFAEAVAR